MPRIKDLGYVGTLHLYSDENHDRTPPSTQVWVEYMREGKVRGTASGNCVVETGEIELEDGTSVRLSRHQMKRVEEIMLAHEGIPLPPPNRDPIVTPDLVQVEMRVLAHLHDKGTDRLLTDMGVTPEGASRMETKHTPGPWHKSDTDILNPDRVFGIIAHDDCEGPDGDATQVVAEVCDGPTAEADANLIAAAPDMYAVCKEIAEHGTDDWDARMRTLLAAIRKARGLE